MFPHRRYQEHREEAAQTGQQEGNTGNEKMKEKEKERKRKKRSPKKRQGNMKFQKV